MRKSFVSILLLQFTIGILLGQTHAHPETGLPFIQNYPPQTTGGEAQNWQILQDKRGLIYSANSSGILQYDGQSWRIIPSPNHGAVRSLAIDQRGTVYFGAAGDFGYLAADSAGRLKTVSLASRLRPADRQFERIEDVLATKAGIYFLSREKLFRWSDNRMQVWYGETPFRRAFAVNDVVYLLQEDVGLLQMSADSLQLLPDGQKFAHQLVYAITPYPTSRNQKFLENEDAILIATHTDGLFLHDGQVLRPFKTEVDGLLKENRIHHTARLPDGRYAVATLKGGVIIMDKTGKFLFQIDKRSGLLSNDVKNIYLDREGGMWLGLQTGVARVEYASPLSFFNEQTGLIGSIGAIIRHQGTLYAASSQGVLYLAPASERMDSWRQPGVPTSRFVAVSGIKAPCWGLLSVNQSLLAATEDGIFQINSDAAVLIPAPSKEMLFALALSRSEHDSNRVFAGLVDGVATLQWNNGKWLNQGRILSTGRRIYNLIEMNKAELWLETRTDVVIRARFSGKGFRNPAIDDYDSTAGLPTGLEIHLVRSGSDLFAYTSRQMFRFNKNRNRFVPDTTFGIPFAEGCSYYSFLINGERGRAWMELDGRSMRVAVRDRSGAYRWLSEPFVKTPHGLIWSFFRDADGTIWFGGDDVLFRYAPPARRISRPDFAALIRRVTTVKSDSTIFGGAALSKGLIAPALAYRDNALRFECAAPSYDAPTANQFQYFLEGFDEGWSRWSTEAKKDYTNLPESEYVFRVRARNVYGHVSSEAAYTFTILPPWYRAWWAYGLYVLLVGGILYGFRAYELSRIRLKEQLKMKRFEAEKLKELDQMKSRFFANISHEFRTPLTLILGPVEQMISGDLDGTTRDKLHFVKKSARRLLRLINQLLDFSQLEVGKMSLRAAPGDIVECVKGITMSFASLAERNQIALRFFAKEQPIEVYFDRDKMEKVVINLLANALKFTPAGGEVLVTVERLSLKPHSPAEFKGGVIQITVSDTGIGIAADQLPRIFDRFYQADHTLRHEYEGTGLGLALAKEFVELHGGRISVESKEGKGTTFTVRLPLGKEHLKPEEILASAVVIRPVDADSELPDFEKEEDVELTAESVVPATEMDNDHLILLVDDHADFRAHLRESLQEFGKVIEARNGAEGLACALETIPDLVISDVMMPKMTGFELCAALKTDERTSHIPVILLTARADQQDKVEGLETGADDYLSKPFDAKELLARVKNLITLRQKLRERFAKQVVLKPCEIAITPYDETFLNRALAIMEEHMSDEAFRAEDFQRAIGLSRTQLHRKLKALTNQSATEFMRSIRLQRAADLLKQNAGTVTEIAYMVGFSSQPYFSKCFQDYFGVSPKEFKKG
ncbi:response regulator [Candidatus Parcubacteria bacterium]|nr:MAG: response regulator [Candidatus Parcubacteria bacterium]